MYWVALLGFTWSVFAASLVRIQTTRLTDLHFGTVSNLKGTGPLEPCIWLAGWLSDWWAGALCSADVLPKGNSHLSCMEPDGTRPHCPEETARQLKMRCFISGVFHLLFPDIHRPWVWNYRNCNRAWRDSFLATAEGEAQMWSSAAAHSSVPALSFSCCFRFWRFVFRHINPKINVSFLPPLEDPPCSS